MDDLPSTLTVDPAGDRLASILADDAGVSADEFLELESAAAAHGVLPLLASRSAGERARHVLREAAVVDAERTAGLSEALGALHAAGVRVLVLKGAHLALAHYDAPHLRPRFDADLFVPEAWRAAAWRALESAGYAAQPQVTGDLIFTQMCFRREARGFLHEVDLHWRVLNPHPFRNLLRFDDAWARSELIPALGPSARGLCDADAMLLAATHPAAHHSRKTRLIWIVDIDRLAASMSAESWADFLRIARAGRVSRVALASLTTSFRLLRTAVPRTVLDALAADDTDQRATAAYLLRTTRAGRLWAEMRALSNWRARARYLRQHLFPAPAYMRATYGGSAIMLPWHYVARIAFGAVRWLRKAD